MRKSRIITPLDMAEQFIKNGEPDKALERIEEYRQRMIEFTLYSRSVQRKAKTVKEALTMMGDRAFALELESYEKPGY